jgi:hypothetical protein
LFLFLGVVIIILLIYALIIRPLTQGNSGRRFNGYDPNYAPGRYGRFSGGVGTGYGDFNRSGFGGTGFGGNGLGMLAGGFAAGALLTWLLEQGRINEAQYEYYQMMDQERLLEELQAQNILQQDEIDHLMTRFGQDGNVAGPPYDSSDYDTDRDFGNSDPYFDSGFDNDFDTGPDDGQNWV